MAKIENTQDLLPLGSVVDLKTNNGTKIMIIGRLVLTEINGTQGYFEYSAVVYPDGIESADQLLFFNNEDINQVYHAGFSDQQENELQQQIKQLDIDYPKLSAN